MAPQRFGSNLELIQGVFTLAIAAAVAVPALKYHWGWWAWVIAGVFGLIGVFNLWQGIKWWG